MCVEVSKGSWTFFYFYKQVFPNKYYQSHLLVWWGSGSEILVWIKSTDVNDSHLKRH